MEDDPRLGPALVAGLREEGLLVDHAQDGHEADLFVRDRRYDVIILDRLLPGVSGDELLARWRQQRLTTPVLLLTALDSVGDRVAGLRGGADDYLCKPFAFAELLARVEALARRSAAPVADLTFGALRLEPSTRRLRVGDRAVTLTGREYALMELFIRHPGQVMTRDQIAAAAWDEPWEASDNLIEAHVKNLRRKLALVAGDGYRLRTVRGVGYVLEGDRS
ncbi:response regulator transcription factor [Caldinitratiruptor microaerophilus]|uniref:Stage 0 sporulation protein A homolog n=1 Tax=Caldinitratiruptor microaerophilus TaxID=671077 RepID=A0AA35CM37_9FIRM|nr:response regulator transcription factor [Caldinitratiruptor microaerophilus]BDG61657.1 DNA-binding response regulator [Caldinitratiruptor microaerophilus]